MASSFMLPVPLLINRVIDNFRVALLIPGIPSGELLWQQELRQLLPPSMAGGSVAAPGHGRGGQGNPLDGCSARHCTSKAP